MFDVTSRITYKALANPPECRSRVLRDRANRCRDDGPKTYGYRRIAIFIVVPHP